MAKEKTNSEEEPVATVQQGEEAQPAPVQDAEGQPVTGEDAVKAGPSPARKVPFNEDPEIQNYIDRQVEQRTLRMYQPNMPQQQQPTEEQVYRSFLQQKGIDPDGFLTPLEQAKLMNEFVRINNEQVQRQNFFVQNKDYNQLIGIKDQFGQFIGPDGKPSAFQRALNDNQYLVNVNDPATAYALARQQIDLEKSRQSFSAAKQEDTQLKIEAKTAPVSSASVGSGGAISEAARMGDPGSAEFQAFDAKVAAGEFDSQR
jgi:hypothetical protein